MKGIILAGGSGTRLYPLTLAMSKQLMPVYDKPMVYYPLSTLMLAGIKEILIITTPKDQAAFENLLGDGSQLGITIEYVAQPSPDGLPQAFILGEEFVGGDSVVMMNGDNLLYGSGLSGILQDAVKDIENNGGHRIFGYHVPDPERSGVVEFDKDGNVLSIEEKPAKPKSSYAILGLYFFDHEVAGIAKTLKPSARGELEMVDLHNHYLQQKKLKVTPLPRGVAWLDTGLHSSLLQASNFVQIVEERQGLKIGCIEEVAYRMGYIPRAQLEELGNKYIKSGYGKYLLEVAAEQV
jgi:glucose-1-phosphate thymidylyltransferase